MGWVPHQVRGAEVSLGPGWLGAAGRAEAWTGAGDATALRALQGRLWRRAADMGSGTVRRRREAELGSQPRKAAGSDRELPGTAPSGHRTTR